MQRNLPVSILVLIPAVLSTACGNKKNSDSGPLPYAYNLTEECDATASIQDEMRREGFTPVTAHAFATMVNSIPEAKWTDTITIASENYAGTERILSEADAQATEGTRYGSTTAVRYNPADPLNPEVQILCAYKKYEKRQPSTDERHFDTLYIGSSVKLGDTTSTPGIRIELKGPETFEPGNENLLKIEAREKKKDEDGGKEDQELMNALKDPPKFVKLIDDSLAIVRKEGCTGKIEFFRSPNKVRVAILVESKCPTRARNGGHSGALVRSLQIIDAL